MRSLEGRVAVVTGSTTGIGRGIAEHFAQCGARIVVHGRAAARGAEVLRALHAAGAEADFLEADLADPQACRRLIRFAVERFGAIDVLVNNAASTARGDLATIGVERWDAIMHVNLRAPFVCLQEAAAHMKGRGGSVVNIGSINAYIGAPKLGAYSVSKGALMTLTKNAAALFGQDRIRVNQLNVGWTLTEGEHEVQRREGRGEDWALKVAAARPFGRLLTPQDVAFAAAYFASDQSACVSGAVMDLEQFPVGMLPDEEMPDL